MRFALRASFRRTTDGGGTLRLPGGSASRRGMTLVELLVVIVLITVLVSSAIPVISPGGADRKLREGSRNVNAYLQGAQARAIQTGRPFGVAFHRLSAQTERGEDNAVCLRMEYVEVPAWYSGFSPTSAVRIARSTAYNPPSDNDSNGADDIGPLWVQFVQRAATGSTGMPAGWAADLTPPNFFRPGDTLEVHGQRYTLLNGFSSVTATADALGYFPSSTASAGGLLTLLAVPEGTPNSQPIDRLAPLPAAYDANGVELRSGTVASPPAPYWTEPTPYRIFRQPIPAGGEPLELPNGVAIDLQACVFGNGTRVYDPGVDYNTAATSFNPRTQDFMVLFSPEGAIDRVHGVGATGPMTATSYLALCVGRRELIPAKVQGAGTVSEPIDLSTALNGLSENEAKTITDQYNWLNLDSRWVLIGAQSGAISTVDNSAVYPGPATATMLGQLSAALENAPRRTKAGGR